MHLWTIFFNIKQIYLNSLIKFKIKSTNQWPTLTSLNSRRATMAFWRICSISKWIWKTKCLNSRNWGRVLWTKSSQKYTKSKSNKSSYSSKSKNGIPNWKESTQSSPSTTSSTLMLAARMTSAYGGPPCATCQAAPWRLFFQGGTPSRWRTGRSS